VNPEIQAYKSFGLFVTLASVETTKRGGVEVGLAERYEPWSGTGIRTSR